MPGGGVARVRGHVGGSRRADVFNQLFRQLPPFFPHQAGGLLQSFPPVVVQWRPGDKGLIKKATTNSWDHEELRGACVCVEVICVCVCVCVCVRVCLCVCGGAR